MKEPLLGTWKRGEKSKAQNIIHLFFNSSSTYMYISPLFYSLKLLRENNPDMVTSVLQWWPKASVGKGTQVNIWDGGNIFYVFSGSYIFTLINA